MRLRILLNIYIYIYMCVTVLLALQTTLQAVYTYLSRFFCSMYLGVLHWYLCVQDQYLFCYEFVLQVLQNLQAVDSYWLQRDSL